MGLERTHVGGFHLLSITCDLNKTFLFNERCVVLKGEEFYDDGVLDFPGEDKEDKTFMHFFGPFFYCPIIVYARNDTNRAQALQRLTCCREPTLFVEVDGVEFTYDRWLRNNQTSFIDDALRAELGYLKERISTVLVDSDEYELCRVAYMEQPHAKRKERVNTLEEVKLCGTLNTEWDPTSHVNSEIKIETGRNKKLPRQFISLGTKSILLAGFIMSKFKDCFTEQFGCDSEFVSGPTVVNLTRVFSRLMDPETLYFCYYSDDSCCSIRCVDGVFMANIDISSCDTSHEQALFDLLVYLCELDTVVQSLLRDCVAQLCSALNIVSSEGYKVVLLFGTALLYTGSIITTPINNLANRVILASIKRELAKHIGVLRRSDCRALIVRAAENCGYIVTVDVCNEPQELQFLKTSPVLTMDGWIPCLNLGVILRVLGHCWGDLPGKDRIEVRAYDWQAQLVASFVHSGDHSLLRVLRCKYPMVRKIKRMESMVNKLFEYRGLDFPGNYITDEELSIRYSLSHSELHELLQQLEEAQVGDMMDCIASRKILSKDYGYEYPAEFGQMEFRPSLVG